MGPLSARTQQGRDRVPVHPGAGQPAGRARQEVANEGYGCGAVQPATGKALVMTATARTSAVYRENWIAPEVERVDAIMDNLNVHTADAVGLFSLAHPRWESAFQPTYAAYLNVIEPWGKIVTSLALPGRCFETWVG